VQPYLAAVQRARGAEPVPYEPAATDVDRPLDRKLKRALRKLSACAELEARASPERAETAGLDRCLGVRSEQHLQEARVLASRCRYSHAAEALACARRTAGPLPDPGHRLAMLQTDAVLEAQLGHRDRALEQARAGSELAKELGAVDARILFARVYAQAGDLERASATLDALEAVATKPLVRAELEEARGELALRLGSPERALEHLERALEGQRVPEGEGTPAVLHLPEAAIYQLQGEAYRMAGDFPEAKARYFDAYRLRKADPSRCGTARVLNSIGDLRVDVGDWLAADEAFQEAFEILLESLGPRNPETLTTQANRELAHFYRTRSDEAAAAYGRTVEALAAVLATGDPLWAAAVRNQSHIELDRGNAERARELLEQALDAQLQRFDPGHPNVAATRLQRGRVLARLGRLDEAAAQIDQAIDVFVKTRGPEHPTVFRARIERARVAIGQGDDARALAEAVAASQAMAGYTRRTFGALSERQRTLLSLDSRQVVGLLLSVPAAAPRDLFVALLPHRDSVLRSVSATRAAARDLGGDGSAFGRELASLRQRYVEAVLGQGPDAAERVKELESRIDAYEAAAGGGAEQREPSSEEVLARACQRLSSGIALVKFIAYDRVSTGTGEPSPAYTALVLHGGDCTVARVDLGDAAGIDEAATRFGLAMRRQVADSPKNRRVLGERLLVPLTAALRGAERWFVVPDGTLWAVPIGALPDPETKDRYLFERVTLGYLTSTHELADERTATETAAVPAVERGSLLIGAPDFGRPDQGPSVLTPEGPCQMAPFTVIPATLTEIEDISKLVPSPTILVGADASKLRLRQALAARPRLVHFATHAYFAGLGGCGGAGPSSAPSWREGRQPVDANPLLLSGMAMAGANEPIRVGSEEKGGILTAYEIAGLDLRGADLVVLSACDTGTGVQLRGQEIQGLRWGFRAAGARALVTSLWRSNDAATRKLMTRFYEALYAAETADDPLRGAEALRAAQLVDVARERRLGMHRPLDWANFIFSGAL
jgi:CHAT domain-containing protein/tetratricopeptide (TPR) repeat protein